MMARFTRHARSHPPRAEGFDAELKGAALAISRYVLQPILDGIVTDIDRDGAAFLNTACEIDIHIPMGDIDDTPRWTISLDALVDDGIEGWSTWDGRLVDVAAAEQLHKTLLRISDRLGACITAAKGDTTDD